MKLTLISSVDGSTTTAQVTRMTATQVQVRTPDGRLHTCTRRTGLPYGTRNLYRIAPEDLAQVQGTIVTEVRRLDQRKGRGTPPHWNV